jgi:hypothetical protein
MRKSLVLTAFVFFMVIVFVGCEGSRPSALVGNWLLEDGQNYVGIVEHYKLEKNGSGIADTNAISWKIENGRFSFVYESSSTAYVLDYKITGKTLVITLDDGKSYRYKKTVDEDNSYRKWRSMMQTDPITDDDNIYFRVMSSTNPWRYLYIRRLNGKLEMYITWGIEIASSTDVIFRIDDKEPETKKWTLSSDKKTLFYPGDPLPVIKQLLDAEKVSVRCRPSNQGILTEVFDISGFREIVAKYNNDLQWF